MPNRELSHTYIDICPLQLELEVICCCYTKVTLEDMSCQISAKKQSRHS